ncbi:response regulator transcription factor [Candidatus Entotheonella palauensis]|uniref:response regulator transcription factor n=1 Tax=Candidatus Entotheonella palauensis TaxID=93172 RepID=UPI000B7DDB05|nr:response regulator transcription factor [Candidatus Entotheonella palauensis]
MHESESQTINILIVDDHPMVREGLETILQRVDGMQVVGMAETGREAVMQAEALNPDIMLLDIELPDLDGLTVLRQIKALMPHIAVLMVTMDDDEAKIEQAIKAGAAGYVLKVVRSRDLIAAIRTAVASDIISRPFVVGKTGPQEGAPGPLSVTDKELLQLLADGLSNKEIAAEMKCSLATTKKHVQRVFELLNVSDRAHAVATALRNGLIK